MDRDVNIIVGSNFHPIDLKSGMLPLSLPLRREGLYSLKAFAPMQYRHEIGHALANFAFAADTKRKTSVPLFFASTGGLRLPLFHAYTASVASIHWLLQSSTPQIFSKYRAQIVLFHAYRVNIVPYYLFTLKNTFYYQKLYDIRVFVWLIFSSSIHIEGCLNGEFLEFCVQGLR